MEILEEKVTLEDVTPPPPYTNNSSFDNPNYGFAAGQNTAYPIVAQPISADYRPYVTVTQQQPKPVPDFTGLAIFSCLCCLWPVGLFAVLVAIQSRNYVDRGDFDKATTAARWSCGLSILSILGGIGIAIALCVIYVG